MHQSLSQGRHSVLGVKKVLHVLAAAICIVVIWAIVCRRSRLACCVGSALSGWQLEERSLASNGVRWCIALLLILAIVCTTAKVDLLASHGGHV